MARRLITLGLVRVRAGLRRPWRGRLPGDIVSERASFWRHLPLAISLVISLVRSLILRLLNR